MVEKILNNTIPYGKIRASHEGSLHSSTLKIEFVVLIQDDTLPSVNKVVNDPVEKHNSEKFVQSSLEGTIDLTDVSPKSWFGRIIKPVKRLDM